MQLDRDQNIGGLGGHFVDANGYGDLDAYFMFQSNIESNAFGMQPQVGHFESGNIK